jgi:hypothetical protein
MFLLYSTYFDMLISFKVCFSVHFFRWRVLFYIFLILFQHFYHGWNNLPDFYTAKWLSKWKYIVGVRTDQTAVPLISYRCNIREFHLLFLPFSILTAGLFHDILISTVQCVKISRENVVDICFVTADLIGDDWRKSLTLCLYSVGFRIHPRSSYIFCRRCFRVMFRIKMLLFGNHAVKISISYLSYLRGAFVPAEPSLKLSSLPHL